VFLLKESQDLSEAARPPVPDTLRVFVPDREGFEDVLHCEVAWSDAADCGDERLADVPDLVSMVADRFPVRDEDLSDCFPTPRFFGCVSSFCASS
jgi:hypothetical protein